VGTREDILYVWLFWEPCYRVAWLESQQLKEATYASPVSLGETLEAWQDEIARMWRFSRNNGITEGFHTKMEMISRRAFGFKNFDNYRLRVRACCC
jgi:transposase